MELFEIKEAVDEGKIVHLANPAYTVIKNSKNGDYLIKCVNGSCIGLTWEDGETLNGLAEDFYILDLFETPELVPENVMNLFDEFSECGYSYD